MNTWQPIETAPKDGTLVLTCVEGVYYRPITGVWSSYHPNQAGKTCWRTSPVGGDKIAPTHWMPLPDPPKEESK